MLCGLSPQRNSPKRNCLQPFFSFHLSYLHNDLCWIIRQCAFSCSSHILCFETTAAECLQGNWCARPFPLVLAGVTFVELSFAFVLQCGRSTKQSGFPVGILPSPLPPLQNSCTPKILTCLCAFMCRCGLNSAPSHVHASSALKLLQNSVFVRNCFARTVEPRKHKIQIIPTSTTRKAFPMSSGCKYICWAVVFHVYCNVSEP
jgi:hypothetical protein